MSSSTGPIATAVTTVATPASSSSLPAITIAELLQHQYNRGKAFSAWSNLFRMMLKGDLSATDYDGLVSRTVLPQIQSINNVFRSVIVVPPSSSSSSSSASTLSGSSAGSSSAEDAAMIRFRSQWASTIQNLERQRYDGIVQYQQGVIDHLTSLLKVEDAHHHDHHTHDAENKKDDAAAKEEKTHHHHHCCSQEKRAHATSCLFFDGNGTRALGTLAALQQERDAAPTKPIGSNLTVEKDNQNNSAAAADGGSEGGSASGSGAASQRAQLVAQQKAFISTLMSSANNNSNKTSTSDSSTSYSVHNIPPFLAFGSQKTIPTVFDLSLEYVVPVEWVEEVRAVGEVKEAAAGEANNKKVNNAIARGSSKKAAAAVIDSDEEPEEPEEEERQHSAVVKKVAKQIGDDDDSDAEEGGGADKDECRDAAAHDDEEEDAAEDDEDLAIRRAATNACAAFAAKVHAIGKMMAKVEASLQDAVDEALEEMQG